MPRLPRVTAKEAVRAVERDGWRSVKSSGGHRHFRHPTKPGRVTIPIHGSGDLTPGTVKGILAQAGLSVEAFIDLL